MTLSAEQRAAVETPGSLLLVACPGSGKTRTLAYKVADRLRTLGFDRSRRMVAAVTFTNRGADEIKSRLSLLGVDHRRLWAGTIHSFALEWILRPYAAYVPELRYGFTLAGDSRERQLRQECAKARGVDWFSDSATRRDREGEFLTKTPEECQVAVDYHQALGDEGLIDYDTELYLAHRLLNEKQEIARRLSKVFSLICVDEYQDTQDLQYSILGSILKNGETDVFLVGDPNQAIYTGLGGRALTHAELEDELQLNIQRQSLTGCYRSTQRLVDYYAHFQVAPETLQAVGPVASENGLISYHTQVAQEDLGDRVARIIKDELDRGVPESDICVVAPQWRLIQPCARALASRLPQVGFDAPGVSPLGKRDPDNLWYLLATLLLSQPAPRLYSSRRIWANRASRCLEEAGSTVDVRRLLAAANSTRGRIHEEDGVDFLRAAFTALLTEFDVPPGSPLELSASKYIEAIEARLEAATDLVRSTEDMQAVFQGRTGVTINTCHGLKGEEFHTVIAFGLLKGYIPHWGTIYESDDVADLSARRLLYVTCSRAKCRLHLFSETGRWTRTRNSYVPTEQLAAVAFDYDEE